MYFEIGAKELKVFTNTADDFFLKDKILPTFVFIYAFQLLFFCSSGVVQACGQVLI